MNNVKEVGARKTPWNPETIVSHVTSTPEKEFRRLIESRPPNPLSETDLVHETLTAIIHR